MKFLKTRFSDEFRFIFRAAKTDLAVKIFVTSLGLLAFAMSAVAVLQLKNLNTEYSVEQFFPAKHQLLTQTSKIRRTFQLQESPAYLVVLQKPAGDENWLEKKSIQRLQALTEKVQGTKGVRSAFSLATLEGALEDHDSLSIGPIYERLPKEKWVSFTQTNQLLRSQLISEDFKSVLLIVEPHDMPATALHDFALGLKNTVAKTFPEVKTEIGGVPAIQGRFSEKLYQELRLFLILSMVAFCFVFSLFFRGFSAFLLTFVSLIFTNLVVLGVLCYYRIPFSVLLSTLPIIVSIALISVNVHSLHRWAEILQHHPAFQSKSEKFFLCLQVLKEMALPNFLGSLTTSIGFATLCVTDIPLIRQYGYVVAGAVMGTWFLAHILLVGFMWMTNPQLKKWTMRKSYWTLPILRHSTPLFGTILVFTLAMAYAGQRISFSGRLFDDLPKKESARLATEQIDREFGGVISYEITLNSQEKDFWKEPKNLRQLDDSVKEIRKWPALGSAIALPDFFNQKIPAKREAVAETLFLFSMAAANPLKNYITEDGKRIRVAIRFHDLPSHLIENGRRQVMRYMQKRFPGIVVQESGLAVTSHTINQEVAKGLVFGFWHSLILIGFLLMIVFGSMRWALVACLPNLVPPALLMGSLALAGTPVKPGVALIFSIALGLAFNNTVYLLSRLKRIMEEKNMNALPLKRAMLQEGNPCLFETMIMFFGFVIFMSSDFKLNQTFGIYMVLSIFAGALGDLIFLPAMLNLFPGMLRGKKAKLTLVKTGLLAADKETRSSSGVVASVALLVLISLGTPQKSYADAEATQILKAAQKNLQSKDDQATVKMKIIEANGEVKTRNLKLQTLHTKGFSALVRIQAPPDIKGTAFLSEISDSGKETQWLYLPSTKQVRRVVGGKKSAGVLGSELTPDDLNSTAVQGSQVKVVKKDAQNIVLEVTPKAGTSPYTKVLTTLSTKDMIPVKTQYYQKSTLKKTVEFLDYKKIDGKIWRAQTVKVRNLANKRGTDLELTDIKVNSGLTAEDFSVNALKND